MSFRALFFSSTLFILVLNKAPLGPGMSPILWSASSRIAKVSARVSPAVSRCWMELGKKLRCALIKLRSALMLSLSQSSWASSMLLASSGLKLSIMGLILSRLSA